jgi:hypothetical protein
VANSSHPYRGGLNSRGQRTGSKLKGIRPINLKRLETLMRKDNVRPIRPDPPYACQICHGAVDADRAQAIMTRTGRDADEAPILCPACAADVQEA